MAEPIRRGDDRRVTFGGLATAAALLGLAAVVSVTAAAGSRTTWLAIHLALAGAAGTAVAAVLPFFTAALGRVAPARPAARIAAVGLVAGGALAVSGGVAAGVTVLAVAGGTAYLGGVALVAATAFLPLRASLGIGLRIVPLAYAAALGCVFAGAMLGTAMVAGWQPVLTDWPVLKPAHAWLNVFGFLSVVIAATLVHLAPTVAGTRIRPRRSASVALAGLAVGAPVVAIGFASLSDGLTRLGALLELAGAVALVVHGIGVQRDRGRWTSDAEWHRFTSLSLLAGPAWFLFAVALATEPILRLGADPAAWSIDRLAAPLAVGWVGQVLIGSWTHLVPAIGPGDQAVHARQRRLLGGGATARLLAWNGGLALVVLGGPAGLPAASAIGAAVVGAGFVATLVLLVAATVVIPTVTLRPGST